MNPTAQSQPPVRVSNELTGVPSQSQDLSSLCVPPTGVGIWDRPGTGECYARFASAAWYGQVLDTMLDMLPLRGDYRVIDVGSGTGSGSLRIANRLTGDGSVLGIDASRVQVEFAQSQLPEGSPVSYRALSLAEASTAYSEAFDCAVFCNSIHLLGKLPEVLSQTAPMLKPGGYVGFCSGYSSAANDSAASAGLAMTLSVMRELADSRFPAIGGESAESSYGPRTLFSIRIKSLERDVAQAGFCDLTVEFRNYQLPMESVIEFLSLPGIGETILPERIALSDRRAIIAEVLESSGLTHVPRSWCFATARRGY